MKEKERRVREREKERKREREKERKRERKKKKEKRKKKKEKEKEKRKRKRKAEENQKREKMFFLGGKNVSKPSNPPDELAQNVSEKIHSDELFLLFSSKVQNLTVFSIIYMIRIRFFGHR